MTDSQQMESEEGGVVVSDVREDQDPCKRKNQQQQRKRRVAAVGVTLIRDEIGHQHYTGGQKDDNILREKELIYFSNNTKNRRLSSSCPRS